MNNSFNNSNAVGIHSTTFDADSLQTIVISALEQEYTNELKSVDENPELDMEEKIKSKRKYMYIFITSVGIVMVVAPLLKKYVF